MNLGGRLGLGCVLTLGLLGLLGSPANAPAGAATPHVPGYWLAGSDGGVFNFSAPFFGSGNAGACGFSPPPPSTVHLAQNCRAISSDPDGAGYWLLNAVSAATPFGNAALSPQSCTSLNGATGSWSGMAVAQDGHGFWRVSLNGGVMGCGSMPAPLGGVTNLTLADFIVGMAATPDRHGYWLVGADGGVFSFGDANFYGSTGNMRLNRPIVGIAATADGGGYWLVASDGGVFAFGDATYQGSMGGHTLNAPVVGIAVNPDGGGYWLAASDGGVFALGGAPYQGSMGGKALNGPIVGIASTPGI